MQLADFRDEYLQNNGTEKLAIYTEYRAYSPKWQLSLSHIFGDTTGSDFLPSCEINLTRTGFLTTARVHLKG